MWGRIHPFRGSHSSCFFTCVIQAANLLRTKKIFPSNPRLLQHLQQCHGSVAGVPRSVRSELAKRLVSWSCSTGWYPPALMSHTRTGNSLEQGLAFCSACPTPKHAGPDQQIQVGVVESIPLVNCPGQIRIFLDIFPICDYSPANDFCSVNWV